MILTFQAQIDEPNTLTDEAVKDLKDAFERFVKVAELFGYTRSGVYIGLESVQ